MTDENLEKRIRAALADAAADVEPTGTLAGLRARIGGDPGLEGPRGHRPRNRRGAPARGGPDDPPMPGPHVPREVPDHLLMCGIHWRLVPPPAARAVYAAYDHGAGIGTPELIAAQAAAIRIVNRAIGETGHA